MSVPRKKCSLIITAALWAVILLTYYYVIIQKQTVACCSKSPKQLTAAKAEKIAATAKTTAATAKITAATLATSPLSPSTTTRRQLLLVSYGRSGSSFTSAIISHDPEVFFIFEPFHSFGVDLNGDTVPEKTQQHVFRTMEAFLQCDFRDIDARLFADELFESSNSTKTLYRCLKNNNLTGHSHVQCFLSTWHSCHTHNLTLIKTIRFRAEWAEYFLRRFRNLKILYLVRDARAVLHSQARYFLNSTRREQAAENAEQFCQNVLKDFQIFYQLNSNFPGRIKGIRYEDGCLYPEDFARTIYEFAGLNFTNVTKQYLQEITKSNKGQDSRVDPYSVVRNDSVQAMNNWRQTADFETVKKIETICNTVNSLLGYKPVRSKEDLVSDLMLVTPVYNKLFSTFSSK